MAIAGNETGVADESGTVFGENNPSAHAAQESPDHALQATSGPPCPTTSATVYLYRNIFAFVEYTVLAAGINSTFTSSPVSVSPFAMTNGITAAWGRQFLVSTDAYDNWYYIVNSSVVYVNGTNTSTYTVYTGVETESPSANPPPSSPIGYPVFQPYDAAYFPDTPTVSSTSFYQDTFLPTGSQSATLSSELDYAAYIATIYDTIAGATMQAALAALSPGDYAPYYTFRDVNWSGGPPYDDSLVTLGEIENPTPSSGIAAVGTFPNEGGPSASIQLAGWQSKVLVNGPYILATYWWMIDGSYVPIPGMCTQYTCSPGSIITIAVPDFSMTTSGPYTGWTTTPVGPTGYVGYANMPVGVVTWLIDCAGCDAVNTI